MINRTLGTEQHTVTPLAVIVSRKKSHVSHHIIFITVCAQNVLLQYERKRVDVKPLAISTFNNRVTHRAAHSLLVS